MKRPVEFFGPYLTRKNRWVRYRVPLDQIHFRACKAPVELHILLQGECRRSVTGRDCRSLVGVVGSPRHPNLVPRDAEVQRILQMPVCRTPGAAVATRWSSCVDINNLRIRIRQT